MSVIGERLLDWKEEELKQFERREGAVLSEMEKSFLDSFRQDAIGCGTTAEVRVVRGEPGFQNLVVKRKTGDPIQVYDISLRAEFESQQKAYFLTQEVREKNPRLNGMAFVPRPLAYMKETDRADGKDKEIIIMERVRGKTLWRLLLENYLHTHFSLLKQEGFNGENLHDLFGVVNDEDFIREFFTIVPEEVKKMGNVPKQFESFMWNMCFRKRSAILTPEQFQSLYLFVLFMKRNRFYHRDFHARNVMLDHQGRVYVIDYGLATFGEESEEKAMQTQIVGQSVLFTGGYGALLNQLRQSGNGVSDDDSRGVTGTWISESIQQLTS